MTQQQEEDVRLLAERFAGHIEEILRKAEKDFTPNPFLSACLGLNRKDEKRFFLTQRVQRSIVTSFGSVLESVAKALDHKTKIEDVDFMFEKGGVRHYVQFKSGPEGFTGPALSKTKETFKRLKKSEPTCCTVIAFGYGARQSLSPVWGKSIASAADKVLVGEEFWDYFSGEGVYLQIIEIFKKAGFSKDINLFKHLEEMISRA
jgi:hypothetical protein